MELLGYLASIFMGLSLGMIGGGGSILTVPILVYLFGIDPVLSTAYSLFIVGLTALVGGLSYLKKGQVDLKTGLIFAVPSFIGVYLTRAFVVPSLPDPVFSLFGTAISKALLVMLVFAILMVLASVSMIRSGSSSTSAKKELSPGLKGVLISLEGLVVGGITGFVGAGGGFLIIPALVVLVGLPMKVAVGTSLFIIAAKSLLGFIGDLQTQAAMDWGLLFSAAAIAVIGLFLGMLFSKKVSDKALKKGFGWFVLIMGIAILGDQIRTLNQADLRSPEVTQAFQTLEGFTQMRENLAGTLDQRSEPITQETFKAVCAPVGKSLKQWASDHSYSARQVSEKFRNPNHAPHEGEQEIYRRFERESDLREVVVDQKAGVRIYKRIPVAASCLHCHGAKETRPDFVKVNYPEDRAYDFKVGDLRGLYSVFIPKDSKQTGEK